MIKANTVPIVGGARTTVSPSASPFNYRNQSNQRQAIVVSGGTVTLIEVSRDGVAFDPVGTIAGNCVLNPQDRLRVTYVLAPTVAIYPL